MTPQPRHINADEQIKVGSITSIIIADAAIITDKIADENVTTIKLADGAALGNLNPGDITTSFIDINGDLTFNNYEALSFRLENLTSDPTPGNPGRLIWRTDLSQVRVDDGIEFLSLAGHIIEDEGITLIQRAILNFVGSGVTVTDTGTKTQVDIPGNSLFAKDLFTVINPLDYTLPLSNTPITSSEIVGWNGLLLRPGIGNDYTILGSVITLESGITLTVGDQLIVVYAF